VKSSNRLMALSSAAVLTVYAAGYFRTKPAAARFAHEAANRRPAATMPDFVAPVQAAASDERAAAPADPAPVADRSEPAEPTVAPARSGPAAREHRSADPTSAASLDSPAPASAPPSTIGFALDPVPAAPEQKAADQKAADAPAAAASPTPVVQAASAQAAPAPAAAPAAAAAVAYKDGTYLGWGWCRHGQIQAAVVIEAGRISSASIAQCLTRYSCSWIAALPPQVARRQSAEVDYVSGATDSTNAFFYAVVDALAKAK